MVEIWTNPFPENGLSPFYTGEGAGYKVEGASATEVPTSVGATPDAPRFYQYFEQYVVWRSHSSGL